MNAETSHKSQSSGSVSLIAAEGDMLHLWLRARGEGKGDAQLRPVGQSPVAVSAGPEFLFHEIALDAGQAELTWDRETTDLSAAYIFSPTNVFRDGIRLLVTSAANTAPDLPGNYHFRPPFGWMNDPNGMIRYGGLYHMFYQHYPHALVPNTQHWGHAVSDDLVRWRHLPVFLRPLRDRFLQDNNAGGAWSGSAIEQGDGSLRVFYTDHMRDRTPEVEVQHTAVSRDGINAEQVAEVVPARPEGLNLSKDFRDPYVVAGPDGRLKMTVASRDDVGGVILLYETDDKDGAGGWRFVDVLHRERRIAGAPCECPTFLPLPDGRWVLIYGTIRGTQAETGRVNLSFAIVGQFDGRKFTPEFDQELDFGTDAYAFQALADDDGPVAIAWLANWAALEKGDSRPTAMTLPRRIIARGNQLFTPPHEAVETLRAAPLDCADLAAKGAWQVPQGALELALELTDGAEPLELVFDYPANEVGLRVGPDGIEFLHDEEGQAPARYIAQGATPRRIRCFFDAGSIELFANEGKWTGTRRLIHRAPLTGIRVIGGAGRLQAAQAWHLKT